MPKIILEGQEIEYNVRKSKKARCMRMSISCDANLDLVLPTRISYEYGEKFILKKADWVLKKINFFKKQCNSIYPFGTYKDNKIKAVNFVKERVDYYNKFYNFFYNRIFIKNHKVRWGSCSIRRNLNFNYRILFLPAELADYIVVHELCHLKEMNHSCRFWALVEKICPDHKRIRKELYKIRFR